MEMNLWKFTQCREKYYAMNPFAIFGDIVKSIRWAWQRAVRGYADCDRWSIDEWLIGVLAPMLDDFADNLDPYSGDPEDFACDIHEIATHLRNSSEDQTVQVNEYSEAWLKSSEEDDELTDNCLSRDDEILQWRKEEARKAFRMLGDVLLELRE